MALRCFWMASGDPGAVGQPLPHDDNSEGTVTEAFPWNEAPHYLIRDRDRIYGTIARRRLRAMGIRDKPTEPASP